MFSYDLKKLIYENSAKASGRIIGIHTEREIDTL